MMTIVFYRSDFAMPPHGMNVWNVLCELAGHHVYEDVDVIEVRADSARAFVQHRTASDSTVEEVKR